MVSKNPKKILPVKNGSKLSYLLGEVDTRLQEELFGGSQLCINGSIDIKLEAKFRMISERYEESAMKVVMNIIKACFTAIDVGAHIGIYSLVMAKLVSKRCPILCELHPSYWNELRYNWDGLKQFLYALGYDIFMVDELMDGRSWALFR